MIANIIVKIDIKSLSESKGLERFREKRFHSPKNSMARE